MEKKYEKGVVLWNSPVPICQTSRVGYLVQGLWTSRASKPPSCLVFACLSWKGLSFVLGSCLAVDRGWDRTSVCCYGCRTLEGDGWIIMAMPLSEGADARNWLGPLELARTLAHMMQQRPRVHAQGPGGVGENLLGLCTMSRPGCGALGKP